MSAETAFALAFPLAVPFWAIMILLPRWRWARAIIGSPWIVAAPLVAYAAALAPQFGSFFATVANPEFAGVQALFASDFGTAAVWAHLIAFDLFVGRWMYLDAYARSIPAPAMAPILFFTILLSPVGLVGYLVVRSILEVVRPVAQDQREGRAADPRSVAAAS